MFIISCFQNITMGDHKIFSYFHASGLLFINENLDSYTAHFAQHFSKKPSPQQCCTIMDFDILSTVNAIGST